MSDQPKIRCLIIDDEAPARAVIQKYLSDNPGFEVLGECKNAFEASEAIHRDDPDLIFLDINMPKLTGLKLLESLRRPPLAIITTAYREYALESFELDVVDYLHKPFSLERFMQALNKVRNRIQPSATSTHATETAATGPASEAPEYIFLKEEGQVNRVDIRDIQYIESLGDYVTVHTNHHKHMSYMTMKKILDLLPGTRFARIHKSFIVNISKVNTIDGNRVYLGDRSFPVGATYRADFMSLIKSRMG